MAFAGKGDGMGAPLPHGVTKIGYSNEGGNGLFCQIAKTGILRRFLAVEISRDYAVFVDVTSFLNCAKTTKK